MAEPARPDVFARASRRLALLFAVIVVVLVVVSSVFMYLTVRADIRAAGSRLSVPSVRTGGSARVGRRSSVRMRASSSSKANGLTR